ncbi:tRNA uridine-5-carboxymethylaminomethyl(34) synthesis GTPase MnmE [bacterium (Candidatus Blackallbacteria) CG17_big_fil_post_rev_8_21_14_2_50_48_46]|uniref:tRNA modification GTPase MnmE n=1 Tax=bacterium (Candidatus Blackallbacteria) CG17_big_fil_post_rev_8_21_14_2_50_48_46 TaxID=2014261 RepID=A0A2M7G5C2_9BACT|nr:MAG: tRNA uridine-5-carboxymethylaminomethyl(34) synthesis GTPase MnmE [bacterium (Candidatus Blackallbacteria) CG18_big_fil_WC_8_21_14_2_50_49_26]PIW17022.1 MAG: tRNA uridine-5-carboxymethylaminomethyl(34) synthesis GTPase MnmE [bacterium (Candidatus Blackallbacteria) CG17_big_fil_post_rev_8_21_14_2_50_48_46]PIW48170.1 MAG: tRNA uridine-5-carboxymethylaminomethyl(34) synthesis GTPase MnmE [bacterium (Candidatus Blackallbacteria) CG13_big_fil_rev_8_21_14_2_50_49_14]
MLNDTIAAISTPVGVGAIGIVRLSGVAALDTARKIFAGAEPVSHRASLGLIRDPQSGETLDQALFLYMQGPRSFTGEDVVELHCHGGLHLLRSVLNLCLAAGARPASPGEFSQRAFLNGKLDLTQAEAIMDLIHSRSDPALFQATHQLEGQLSAPIRALREQLLDILAAIEANIDFPDEVDPVPEAEIASIVTLALTQAEKLLATHQAGRIWKEGLRLALIGQPNVGKSTLLNRLLRYERAIVSEIPGTTRDTVEDDCFLGGIPVRLVDTAGLRQTTDTVEKIGIERSLQAFEEADLVLLVLDSARGLTDYEQELMPRLAAKQGVVVWNKIDQVEQRPELESVLDWPQAWVAALENQGMESLEALLQAEILKHQPLEFSVTINERHRLCLLRSQEALIKAQETLTAGLPSDFLAIDLKEATVAFGEMIGASVSDEVIDRVFHRFCVGK